MIRHCEVACFECKWGKRKIYSALEREILVYIHICWTLVGGPSNALCYFTKASALPGILFYIDVRLDVAASPVKGFVHCVGVEIRRIGRHAPLLFALFVGDSPPSCGDGRVLNIFRHGELEEIR